MSKSIRIPVCLLILAVLTTAACCAAVPEKMAYQGKLTNDAGDPVGDGTHSMVFSLYSQGTEGTLLWTETQSVEVKSGLFSVNLGSVNPLPASVFEQATWLSTAVDGNLITPRVQILSAAYAMRASIGLTVPEGAISSGKIGNSAVTAAKIAPNAVSSEKIMAGSVTSGKIATGAVMAEHLHSTAISGIAAGIHSADAIFSVKDYGARGDGVIDDTAAFQSALSAASARGGAIVYAPTGRYRITGTLNIPSNVTLEGVWRAPSGQNAWKENAGTLLLASAGEGNADGTPFITLNNGSTIKGVTIFYPNQTPNLAQPKIYPWTISVPYSSPQSYLTDNASVIDCTIINPYQGVRVAGAGRHYVRGLYGQPLFKGLWVDWCYDVGRVENVHFSPMFTEGLPQYQQLADWQKANGIAFIFGRSDWEYVINTYAYGYKIGYHFIWSPDGDSPHIPAGNTNGNFVGLGANQCQTAVWIDSCSYAGLLIVNGEFAFSTRAVYVGPNIGSGVAKFTNCSFWGATNGIAQIASGHVNFTDCVFSSWHQNNPSQHAITSTGGRLTIAGCSFTTDGNVASASTGVALIVTGNQGVATAELNYPSGSVIANNIP